jgi:hypothetical protein
MSIENIGQIQQVTSDIFGDYGLNGVSLQSEDTYKRKLNPAENKNSISFLTSGSDQIYTIPLASVRNEALAVFKSLNIFIEDMDNILEQVNLKSDASPALEETHVHIWSEVLGSNEQEIDFPLFVSYQEYLYAEKHQCRACRKFIKEYNKLISTTTFGHLFTFRKIVIGLANEANRILISLQEDFGLDYEDESQQQIAAYYSYWLKMASHYKKLFEQTIPSRPTLLPESEVDQISKRQAAQFQTFFSIRVNSETVNIENQLFNLSKDLIEDCNVFYDQFISPVLRLKSKVISDLSLDIRTTNMASTLPKLAEETITALLTIDGNFKSVLTDLLERRNLLIKKIDSLYQSVLSRRKYILYISQLASKALSKNKIVSDEFDPKYSDILKQIIIDRESQVVAFGSSHSAFSDLLEDSHPQYLMKSGGKITGNIEVEDGVSIDGVQISKHSHDGSDGTPRIKSIDIDYDSIRDMNKSDKMLNINDDLNVQIESYNIDILDGGTPVVDAVVAIEIPDYLYGRYDFEILYLEM